MGNILEIKDLSKNFKGLKAVDSVSFAVEEGGITGLIGSNGAGKTTVFNMISGVFPPTAGHIIYKNKEITGMKPYHYTSMGIARTFQIMKPLASMSVLDNVASGALYGRKKYKSVKEAKEYAEEILHFTGLYERNQRNPDRLKPAGEAGIRLPGQPRNQRRKVPEYSRYVVNVQPAVLQRKA